MAANGVDDISLDILNGEPSDTYVSHQTVGFDDAMDSIDTDIKDTIIPTGGSDVGEINMDPQLDSQLDSQPCEAGLQQAEIGITHPGQVQPISEPNDEPRNGSRNEYKRGRSNSNGCVTIPDKRVKIDADDGTSSGPELAVQQIEDGLGRSSVVDLTGDDNPAVDDSTANKETAATAQDIRDGNKVVCIGYIASMAHAFQYPNYGTVSRAKKLMPYMTVTVRDTLCVSGLRFHVVDGNYLAFATIDMKSARFLKDMIKLQGAHKFLDKLGARLLERDRVDADFGLEAGASWNEHLRMNIHVHVPKRIAMNALGIARQHGLQVHQPILHSFPVFEDPTTSIQSVDTMDVCEEGPELIGQHVAYEDADGAEDMAREVERNALNLKALFASADALPSAKQPKGIKTPLLPYQLQGLHFLLERERDPFDPDGNKERGIVQNLNIWEQINDEERDPKTYFYNKVLGTQQNTPPKPYRGGILADEMGLGKTLTVVSLVSETLSEAKDFAKGPPQRLPGKIRQRAKGTLCVVPKTLLESAWMMQIEQHAEKKRLKTFLFYGPIRRNLKNADLKKKLERADVVLTTYSTLVRDYGTNHKPIDDYYWFRMVLDEAHLARNQSSQVARICCKVEASRRWAVTGTPLQNSLLDLGSLVKFLRVYPFDDPAVFHKTIVAPFGKGNQTVFASLRILVDCIALRRTKEKVQGLPKKTEHILPIPMTRNERKCYERLVNDMANLVNRKKEAGRTFSHHFLTGLIRIRRFCAHKQELLTTDDLKMFRGLVSDHPLEIDDDGDEDGHEVLTRQVALDMVQLTLESDCDQCGSCGKKLILEEADEDEDEPRAVYGTMIECFQILCPSCVDEWRKTSKKSDRSANYVRCDLCEEEHRTDAIKLLRGEVAEFLRNQERLQNNKRVAKQLGPYSGPSTKVQFLVQQLNSFRKWNEEHPEKITKAVVFSYWVDHLNLIEIALVKEGIRFCRLDGKMSQDERHRSIQTFQTDSGVIVFLSTIGAGGVGITLTAANHVFIMEPGWNPQAEEQAVDRVHRIGQRQPVRVLRLIADDTIEAGIRDYANKKLKLANVVLDRNLAKREDRHSVFKQLEQVFKKGAQKQTAWSRKKVKAA